MENCEDDGNSFEWMSRRAYETRKPACFAPPMGIQRRNEVVRVLETLEKPNMTICDLGCGFPDLICCARNVGNISRAIGVDIDLITLKKGSNELQLESQSCDRDTPFQAILYHGDICSYDQRLQDVDVVTCIEVIEHMDLESVDKVVEVVFGQVRPMVGLFSTPNVELNVAFGLQQGQFRHSDHKFEWTREQFSNWCANVVAAYPDYSVECYGIGSLDDVHTRMYGHCSQFAVFKRRNEANEAVSTYRPSDCPSQMCPFVEVYKVDFWLHMSPRLLRIVNSELYNRADDLIRKQGGPVVDEFNGYGRWVPVQELHKSLSRPDCFLTAIELCDAVHCLGYPVDLIDMTVFLSVLED
uniref:Small RNA 2'-O-methyltransferase n=1 Tax=Trichuris muris TaxID=70415 RepID=A0A5S6Q8T4_TRIMR